MRILNFTLDENQNILKELTKIYGIGIKRSKKMLDKLNIGHLKTISSLSDEDKDKLKNFLLSKEKTIGNALKRFVNNNIKREITLKSFKGQRYKTKMPVRGQRTRTNSKTSKKRPIFIDIL